MVYNEDPQNTEKPAGQPLFVGSREEAWGEALLADALSTRLAGRNLQQIPSSVF